MSLHLSAPAPIRTDHSNAFAHNTMRQRLPAIIDETIALNHDYPASIKTRLSNLRDAIATGDPIPQLEIESAPDQPAWSAAIQLQNTKTPGELTWHNAEWFFAETYAYRCLIEAVRCLETGRDPFLPQKREELQSEAFWRLLDRSLGEAGSPEEELKASVAFALWANRIDLSYAASTARGTDISADDLLVDERDQLLNYLARSADDNAGFKSAKTVYIVADNAGSELAMDLLLSDCLLRQVTDCVVICLKAHPTFVSDAVPRDVWMMLEQMQGRGQSAAELAGRLRDAWQQERLRFVTEPFWNSCHFLWDLPANLRQIFNAARLVIIKGDANYRRTVGDCLWSPDTAFSDLLRYLDAPVLCLRTLKSDPVIGLPSADLAAQLDHSDPQWRVNGKRGLIQFKGPTSKSQ